jgi:hypothetical protein
MMAAIEWIAVNPRAGIVESEAMDHAFVLAHARRYWEPIVHEFRAWHPRGERGPRRWTLDEFVNLNSSSRQSMPQQGRRHHFHVEHGAFVERRRRDIGIAGRRLGPDFGQGTRIRLQDQRLLELTGSGSQAL